jgi:hypothetical protein
LGRFTLPNFLGSFTGNVHRLWGFGRSRVVFIGEEMRKDTETQELGGEGYGKCHVIIFPAAHKSSVKSINMITYKFI